VTKEINASLAAKKKKKKVMGTKQQTLLIKSFDFKVQFWFSHFQTN
jgi:hypothetical protein